jgi:imidazolonepropionase-like amidohydrolase
MKLTIGSTALAMGLLAIPALSAGCHRDRGEARKALSSVGCEGCTVLQGGMVFDGSRSGTGVVVIEGDHVRDVVFGDPEVLAGEVVDARGLTVLPGLVDLHVHLMSEAGPVGDVSALPHLDDHLKAMLRAGVTSYLDLGSPEHTIFEVRDRVARGAMMGPRTFAVGPLLTPTGGHPCYSGSPPGDFCVFIDAPSDADEAVAKLVDKGPDLLKIVLEGGQSKPLPRMTAETTLAIEQAAEARGKRVIAHVSSAKDVEDALSAGVRLFAHVPSEERISASLAAKMASLGAVVVPTLAVMDGFYRVSHGEQGYLLDPSLGDDVPADVLAALGDAKKLAPMTTPAYKAMTEGWRENAMANLVTLRAAGVTIASGTDAGNPSVFHGLAMARELELYTEVGMTPEEALTAATRSAADVLQRPDLGRLARGAKADVLVVRGDALSDIGALRRVERVYRGGALIDRESLAIPRKTSLVVEPATGATAGEACLGASECQSGLVCDDSQACAPSCHGFGGCAEGSACLPLSGSSSQGACLSGDGCNPILQDCANDAACVPLGNGATTCWYAGTAPLGKPCGPGGLCKKGLVCDFSSYRCKALCDPKGALGAACPVGRSCVDYSDLAGVAVGECE